MTTYCLNPNETWLAVYTLNTGTMPTNNVVFSEITANLTANATSITVKTGEGALFTQGMIATLEQLQADGKTATAREVVLISGISGDTLTLTRGYENCVMDDTASPKVLGNTKQAFTSGARISVYVSRALLNGVQTRLQQVNCPCNTSVYNQEMAITSCIANNCDDWRDVLYKEKARRCYNDCGFGDGSDGDCIISEDTFLNANCNYNFKNLTICSGVLVRFCGAGTPRINVQRKFCNMGTIDLRGGTYVGGCSKKDCITGCTVSNNYCSTCYNAMCFGCGGIGGRGCGHTHCGCAGCNATGSGGGAGGKGGTGHYCYRSSSGSISESYDTEGADGCPAVGYNGGNGGEGGGGTGSYGGDATTANYAGGGGGGGGGYLTGNGGNGGKGGAIYKGVLYAQGGAGGNAGIWGRGGDGGEGISNSNNNTYSGCVMGGKGGNGYIGGNGGGAGSYSISASNPHNGGGGGDGGNGIICGGNGGGTHVGNGGCKTAGKGGDAINNMYGLIIHACEYYNNCIEAQGGKGGDGGYVPSGTCSGRHWGGYGNVGGCGANGGKVSVVYIKLAQAGNVNTAGGLGGSGSCTWEDSTEGAKCPDGTTGSAGRYKICKPF